MSGQGKTANSISGECRSRSRSRLALLHGAFAPGDRQSCLSYGGYRRGAGATIALTMLLAFAGCGINKSRLATEQLVVSDAVDRTVASIDFSPLSGHKVYFDTKYLDGVTLGPAGSLQYVISSLRQQMLAYDCRLQEKPETADYIVEGRVGVLHHDGHEVTYGVPGNAALGTASVLMASPVPIPALPELSLGRRNHQSGTAKIGLFAYDRETREPVWQAGTVKASSQARDSWILGLGPYQKRPSAVPERRRPWLPFWNEEKTADVSPLQAYQAPIVFRRGVEPVADSAAPAGQSGDVATASHEQPAAEPAPVVLPADAKPISDATPVAATPAAVPQP